MAFSYQDYVESERVKALRKKAEEAEKYKESAEVTQARNALAALQKPADYSSKYQPKIDATMAQIENQKPFSYDLNGDMLYQNYKDQFINNGKMAMMNTMGQAAALTGGYGNSYATTAGNQAYQASLQELNAIVPELYQAAYQRYRDDRQDLLDRYGLYTDADARDYAKYRDVVGDYNTDRGYYTDAYNNARNFDYAQYSDMRDYYGNQYNNERSYDYGQYADAYNRAFANYQQGVSESQWAQQMAENKRQFDAQMAYNYSRSSGSGSGGSTSDNTELKTPTSSMLQGALKAYNNGGEDELNAYANSNRGYDIDQIFDYVSQYGNYAGDDLQYHKFTKVKNTINWGGGVDNNDIVRDETTNTEYRLDELTDLPDSVLEALDKLKKGKSYQQEYKK